LLHERAIALGFSLEASSRASYSSALQSYLSFCKSHGFDIKPTPDTLSFYTVFMSHHINPRSVSTYLSGICSQLEPYFPEVREVRTSKLVTKTLRGCTKMRAIPTKRKRPLGREELVNAIVSHPHPSFDDSLFAAILLTSFHGLMRLGESVWPDNQSLQDYRKVILRSSVHVASQSFSFTLPGHKADRLFEGNKVIIQKVNTHDDPHSAFTSYIRRRDAKFPHNPELWLREDGSIPTRSWFMKRLRHLFPGNVGGHSLRAGGATALALAGIPPHIIQAIGRWSSNAFQIYIRQHPMVLAALLYGGSRL
jgi:hypothetical protein